MSSDKSILLKLRYLQEEFNDTERLFSEYNKGFMEELKIALKERGISEDKDPMLSAVNKSKKEEEDKAAVTQTDDSEQEELNSKDEDGKEELKDADDEAVDKNDENLRPEMKKLYRDIVQIAHQTSIPLTLKKGKSKE